MGLYQPTVIAPSQLNGTGVVDATQDLTVTWQINGTFPIIEWQFIIMKNDSESTVLYTSDWRYNFYYMYDPETGENVKTKVYTYGRDQGGKLTPTTDTISASDLADAGIVNNYSNGYKIRINQKYNYLVDNNTMKVDVLVQTSPTYFVAVSIPAVDTSEWDKTVGRYNFFNFHFTTGSYYIMDPVIYKRQRLALADDPDNNVIKDSGNIYLPVDENSIAHLDQEIIYGILKNHTEYAFRANAELESGAEIDTGWVNFKTSWTDTALDYVHLRVYYVTDQPAVFVRLEVDDGYDESIVTNLPNYQRWTIYRVRVDNGEMEKVGIIPKGQNAIYDFGIRNNTAYKYRAYYGLWNDDGYMYETDNVIKMRHYWNWAIIETEKVDSVGYYKVGHSYSNEMYQVVRVHQFQGNVESGDVSNENEPLVENNFTPYPTVQKHGRKGLSGKLRAWVGMVKNTAFSDSIDEINSIMDMSTNETVKFLRDRKGNIRMIEIGDAITKSTQDVYAEQPVEIEIPWVEIGDASECQIVSTLTSGYVTSGDSIVYTTAEISDSDDGYITWEYDDEDYAGSMIDMNDDGYLVQSYDNSMTNYAPATLLIDDDGSLVAETSSSGTV